MKVVNVFMVVIVAGNDEETGELQSRRRVDKFIDQR
jgi:hypothetical protein